MARTVGFLEPACQPSNHSLLRLIPERQINALTPCVNAALGYVNACKENLGSRLGFETQTAVTEQGAGKLDVTHFKNGIFTRGVLIDIPRLKGVPYLEPDVVIYPEDLDAWEKKAGVRVESGDVVFIRTGRWARRAMKGPWNVAEHSAGLYASCAKWLHQRDVAMLGSDAASDALPSRIPGVHQPIHQLVLIALGTPLFDNCDLEALSKAASQRGRYSFLLTAAPLAMPGGTGSPLNPVATF